MRNDWRPPVAAGRKLVVCVITRRGNGAVKRLKYVESYETQDVKGARRMFTAI